MSLNLTAKMLFKNRATTAKFTESHYAGNAKIKIINNTVLCSRHYTNSSVGDFTNFIECLVFKGSVYNGKNGSGYSSFAERN